MMRVLLPVMIPSMMVVLMLNVVRVFQSFETERILGTSIGFFVYSTKIFQQIRDFDPPQYGQATALASVTIILIAAIIPVQRWLLQRRQYTTVT
jgi:ABC-type Fe3+ transport system permease subunit